MDFKSSRVYEELQSRYRAKYVRVSHFSRVLLALEKRTLMAKLSEEFPKTMVDLLLALQC